MLLEPADGATRTAVRGVTADTLDDVLATLPAREAAYARACGFEAGEGQCLPLPGADGTISSVLFGLEAAAARRRDPFLPGRLAELLPAGEYRLAEGFSRPGLAALAFLLGGYRFTRFRKAGGTGAATGPGGGAGARLEVPPGVDAARLHLVAGAINLGRDLVNRPANDLGPQALEAAVLELAGRHGAACRTVVGDALAAAFPMVHAVGRAAAEAPRVVDVTWGAADAPKVTLVGKGVCFDTGGLDIKPSASMLLMKKDMGGAATALALAAMIMGAGLKVRLRLVVPIVENAVAAESFRPGDVLNSRKGFTVEVGNTDAEGRLILADALALADEEEPDLLLDFATLTGAARVALGPDLPAFYTMADDLAAAIARHADSVADPGWRMPLWEPYDAMLKSKVADMNNIGGSPFAGSIIAALFLRRFVERTRHWAHVDLYGWNPGSRPGRPEGGEVQMAHAFFELIAERYGAPA